MKNQYKILAIILSVVFLTLMITSAQAKKPKYLFKVASLAPEGSVWTKTFRNFTREVEEKSGGEIGFKIYDRLKINK